MSFVNATLVLSIGETVEEVTDSGFLGTTPTLSCSLLGEDALVQVSVVFLCNDGRTFDKYCLALIIALIIECCYHPLSSIPFVANSSTGLPRWYSSHQSRQACERVEDSWQENNCPLCCKSATSCYCAHWRGTCLL